MNTRTNAIHAAALALMAIGGSTFGPSHYAVDLGGVETGPEPEPTEADKARVAGILAGAEARRQAKRDKRLRMAEKQGQL